MNRGDIVTPILYEHLCYVKPSTNEIRFCMGANLTWATIRMFHAEEDFAQKELVMRPPSVLEIVGIRATV